MLSDLHRSRRHWILSRLGVQCLLTFQIVICTYLSNWYQCTYFLLHIGIGTHLPFRLICAYRQINVLIEFQQIMIDLNRLNTNKESIQLKTASLQIPMNFNAAKDLDDFDVSLKQITTLSTAFYRSESSHSWDDTSTDAASWTPTNAAPWPLRLRVFFCPLVGIPELFVSIVCQKLKVKYVHGRLALGCMKLHWLQKLIQAHYSV